MECLESPISLLSASTPVLLCYGFRTTFAHLAAMVDNSLRNLQAKAFLSLEASYATEPTITHNLPEGTSSSMLRRDQTHPQFAQISIYNTRRDHLNYRQMKIMSALFIILLLLIVIYGMSFTIIVSTGSDRTSASAFAASSVGVAVGTVVIAGGTLLASNTDASRSSSQSGPVIAATEPAIIGIRHPTYYIMLCLRIRKHLTLRHDISVGEMTRDRELFAAFRGQYYTKLGRIRRMWSLYTVQRIDFVKVSILRVLVDVDSQSPVCASVVQRGRRYRNWDALSRRDTLCIRP